MPLSGTQVQQGETRQTLSDPSDPVAGLRPDTSPTTRISHNFHTAARFHTAWQIRNATEQAQHIGGRAWQN
jgi:hypothetical protein